MKKTVLLRLPGWISSGFMILVTAFWSYWSVGEMYHEGWWGAWFNRLPYLVPTVVTLVPTLMAFRWPVLGGGIIISVGVFAFFFFGKAVAVIGLAIALIGIGFVVEGVLKQREMIQAREARSLPWWRRNGRVRLAVGIPLLIYLGVSAYMLPIVLTRVDDGDRSARLIEGNGVTLVWAPEGPGWNWKQPWGGYPSWQSLALYGVPPVGLEDKPGYGDVAGETVSPGEEEMARYNLCLYLNEAGTELKEAPQNIWRMPTTDEVVRSLVRHGENAGCRWQGEHRQMVECRVRPDKESPLWATDVPVIYYWTADSFSERRGYYVSYNGMVNTTYKGGGNPRHGYRCVREP